jgi:hypothetical protein
VNFWQNARRPRIGGSLAPRSALQPQGMLQLRSYQILNIESITPFFEFQFIFGDHSFSFVGRVRPSGPDVSPKRQPDPMGDPSNCLVQPYYHCWEGRERPIQKPYHTISVIGIACRGSQLRMCVVGQTLMQVMTFPVLHCAGYSEICIICFL